MTTSFSSPILMTVQSMHNDTTHQSKQEETRFHPENANPMSTPISMQYQTLVKDQSMIEKRKKKHNRLGHLKSVLFQTTSSSIASTIIIPSYHHCDLSVLEGDTQIRHPFSALANAPVKNSCIAT